MKKNPTNRFFSLLMLIAIIVFNYGCDSNDPTNQANLIVKDLDGNEYHTIIIGTQTWLVENLKTTKYNDNTAILSVSTNTEWVILITGAYCYYNNNVSNLATYGRLYNWYAVNTGKLAPKGWHIPTDAEWATLVNYVSAHLGTSGSVGKALAAKTNWNEDFHSSSPGNNPATNNSTGFSALPGGFNYGNGFKNQGDFGYFWSTESDSPHAWQLGLNYGISGMEQGFYGRFCGISVRCIKD